MKSRGVTMMTPPMNRSVQARILPGRIAGRMGKPLRTVAAAAHHRSLMMRS
jgi:hypothetical protein